MERIGIQVGGGSKSSLPALERLIAEVAPALGLNWVLLTAAGHSFAYRTRPEVVEPDAMDAADARRLSKLARESGINLLPGYNCLGHQSFRDKPGALLRAHPEFNEAPDMDMNAFRFDNFYSWCPNHPGVYPLVFDLLDELLDAFQPQSFHVGMDEVFVLGECPRCKGTPNSDLFAKAVNDLHRHLVGRRGVTMEMWGDRLLPPTFGYSMWESSHNGTEAAIDLIPADIVISDWHYELKDDYPSVRYFQEKGFRVWPAGWNEPPAVERLIQVSRRDSSDRMVGYMATTWTGVGDLVSALAGEPVEPESENFANVLSCVRLGARLAQG